MTASSLVMLEEVTPLLRRVRFSNPEFLTCAMGFGELIAQAGAEKVERNLGHYPGVGIQQT